MIFRKKGRVGLLCDNSLNSTLISICLNLHYLLESEGPARKALVFAVIGNIKYQGKGGCILEVLMAMNTGRAGRNVHRQTAKNT